MNKGRVTQIMGPVVDVKFDGGKLTRNLQCPYGKTKQRKRKHELNI